MLTLLLACNGDTTPPTGGTDGLDTLENRLAPGTDLCAYEDSAPGLPDTQPVTSVGIDEPATVYAACLDGLLDLTAELIDDDAGRSETHHATATFFNVDQLPGSVTSGAWLDHLDKVDDCGVLQYNSLAANDPELTTFEAGDVGATGAWGTVSVPRVVGGAAIVYDADLEAAGFPASYGDPIGWSATGAQLGLAAVDLPNAVALPAQIELTNPVVGPGYSLVRRLDKEFDWSGTSDGTVVLWIEAGDAPPLYRIQCVLNDDGSYVMPHEVMEMVPPGLPATLTMARDADAWLGTKQGRAFHARAHVGYRATGLVTE